MNLWKMMVFLAYVKAQQQVDDTCIVPTVHCIQTFTSSRL